MKAVVYLVRQKIWPGCGSHRTGYSVIQHFSVILHQDVNTLYKLYDSFKTFTYSRILAVCKTLKKKKISKCDPSLVESFRKTKKYICIFYHVDVSQ